MVKSKNCIPLIFGQLSIKTNLSLCFSFIYMEAFNILLPPFSASFTAFFLSHCIFVGIFEYCVAAVPITKNCFSLGCLVWLWARSALFLLFSCAPTRAPEGSLYPSINRAELFLPATLLSSIATAPFILPFSSRLARSLIFIIRRWTERRTEKTTTSQNKEIAWHRV